MTCILSTNEVTLTVAANFMITQPLAWQLKLVASLHLATSDIKLRISHELASLI